MNSFEKLGLPSNATKAQVKAAWRQLASQHHPDRGGDGDLFDDLHRAYEEAYGLAPNCANCLDEGSVTIWHGFNTISQICPVCRGQGVKK